MIDTHSGIAIHAEGVGDFGIAYTLEVSGPDGKTKSLYLANRRGQVFGNNTNEGGRILHGYEIGDRIEVRGLTYSRIGSAWFGPSRFREYRVMIIDLVKRVKDNY